MGENSVPGTGIKPEKQQYQHTLDRTQKNDSRGYLIMNDNDILLTQSDYRKFDTAMLGRSLLLDMEVGLPGGGVEPTPDPRARVAVLGHGFQLMGPIWRNTVVVVSHLSFDASAQLRRINFRINQKRCKLL